MNWKFHFKMLRFLILVLIMYTLYHVDVCGTHYHTARHKLAKFSEILLWNHITFDMLSDKPSVIIMCFADYLY